MADSKPDSPAAARIAEVQQTLSEIAIVLEDYRQIEIGAAGLTNKSSRSYFKEGTTERNTFPRCQWVSTNSTAEGFS